MIGARIAELRKDHGMTQRELAELLLVSVKTVSSYENSRTSPDDASKVQIAKFFNISLDYLLGVTDEELLLDRSNVVVLPKHFTAKAKKELGKHVELLGFKYKQIL